MERGCNPHKRESKVITLSINIIMVAFSMNRQKALFKKKKKIKLVKKNWTKQKLRKERNQTKLKTISQLYSTQLYSNLTQRLLSYSLHKFSLSLCVYFLKELLRERGLSNFTIISHHSLQVFLELH